MIVIWSEDALRDLQRIFDYIALDSPQAALLVDDRITGQTDILADFPSAGRVGRMVDTRELVIQDTPYLAVYAVDEAQITILRIIHGAQIWPLTF